MPGQQPSTAVTTGALAGDIALRNVVGWFFMVGGVALVGGVASLQSVRDLQLALRAPVDGQARDLPAIVGASLVAAGDPRMNCTACQDALAPVDVLRRPLLTC